MNDLDKYEARKIRRRIEIKQGNLKFLLPEVRFLRFVEELEYFQQVIDGVDTDGTSPHVQLHLARTQFESLQNKYRELLKFFTENSKSIEQHSNDTLLKDLFEAVRESTLFLIANFRNFCSQIEASTEFIYNIQTILCIYDLLSDLKTDVAIVKKNFSNIQRSTSGRWVKETFIYIYSEALTTSSLKFEHLAKSFPKAGNLLGHRLRFTTYRVPMSETKKSDNEQSKPPEQKETKPEMVQDQQQEDPQHEVTRVTEDAQAGTSDQHTTATIEEPQPELIENAQTDTGEKPQLEPTDELKLETTQTKPQPVLSDKAKEGTSSATPDKDIQDDGNSRNNGKQQERGSPQERKSNEAESRKVVVEPVEVGLEEADETDADDSSDVKTPSNFSLTSSRARTKDELRTEMQPYKLEIENALTELTNFENKLFELNKVIIQRRRSFKKNLEEIEKQKLSIADEVELLEDDKPRRLQDVAVQIGQLTGLTEERIQDLEKQKNDIKSRSLVQASKLGEAARELRALELSKIENLRKLLQENLDKTEREEIQTSIYLVKITFAEELGVLKKIQNVENFQVDDHGVYYFDKAKMKNYITSVGSAYLRDSSTIGPRGESASFETSCTASEASSRLDTQKVRLSVGPKASPESSTLTSEITVDETKDQLPLDSETYIKCTLGKPLRQALAAITIYQPTDPINYLANYLLQYRYNVLRNIQRQQDFENLAVQRERYAEKIRLENVRRENMKKPCDPCVQPPAEKYF